MCEPNTSAAPSGAASSSSNVVPKRATSAKQSNGEKRQTTIEKSILVPHNTTTSLGFSNKGLPAPSAAQTRGTGKPTADSDWVRVHFLNLNIIQKLDDSDVRVDVEEAVDTLGMVGLDCIESSPGSFNVEAIVYIRKYIRQYPKQDVEGFLFV